MDGRGPHVCALDAELEPRMKRLNGVKHKQEHPRAASEIIRLAAPNWRQQCAS